jgi:hypothetical protein
MVSVSGPIRFSFFIKKKKKNLIIIDRYWNFSKKKLKKVFFNEYIVLIIEFSAKNLKKK